MTTVVNNSACHHFSQTLRVARSRHTGEWIVEELNTVYGYWATIRMAPKGDRDNREFANIVAFLRGLPAYKGEKHEAAERFDNCTTCG